MRYSKLCTMVVIVFLITVEAFSQEKMEIWNISKRLSKGLVERDVKTPSGETGISPNTGLLENVTDVRVHSSSNPQSENSIAVNPANSQHLMISTNGRFAGTPYIHQTWFFSTNGGADWSGSENLPSSISNSHGDPVALFNTSGRAFFVTLGNPGGILVTSTTNFGSTWSTASNADPSNSTGDDKEHAMTDLSGTYPNNVYVAWTEFGYDPVHNVDTFRAVLFTRSTNESMSIVVEIV